MKRAGCYYVVFGVESANESILKTIDKKESLDDIKKAIATAKKVGLMTQGFFIFGLPGETEETIKNSLRFAKESKLSRAHFMLLDIVPGSRLWGEHKDELSYDIENDDYLSYQEVTWIPPTITKDALKAWQGRAIRKFLFHPRSLYSLLKYFRLWQLENVLSRLKDYRVLSFFDKNKKSK